MGLRTAIIALLLAGASGSSWAQVSLPGVRLPPLPLSGTGQLLRDVTTDVTTSTADALSGVRRTADAALIRNHRRDVEADPTGAPILRGQIVALNIADGHLQAILARGFTLVRQQPIEGMDVTLSVLRVPEHQSTRRALEQLRKLEPQDSFDFDHLYSGSGAAPASSDADGADLSLPPPAAPMRQVGLIDGGVQLDHPALKAAQIHRWGCNGQQVPSAHGTAVASLLVGEAEPFHGAAPDAQLFAADVYCGVPTGGAVDSIVAALGWLSAQRVGVINVSLVGPDNQILRAVVMRLIARGHLIVAAVGNDGPAAPPLYPAAYPGVIGVTAVDAHRHVLLEAERGAQVMFAAPGADMAAAAVPAGYVSVRGTSFAAPLVAGLLAIHLATPDPQLARAALDALQRDSQPLGASGRNTTYGWGLVGESLRTTPNIIQARAAPSL